ncbi:hypothetical protein FRC08_015855 [Ceratobasidium sp. 394]|nr:hypothetical protein FRC08_015855 [Ceratobasidium sp. 394]
MGVGSLFHSSQQHTPNLRRAVLFIRTWHCLDDVVTQQCRPAAVDRLFTMPAHPMSESRWCHGWVYFTSHHARVKEQASEMFEGKPLTESPQGSGAIIKSIRSRRHCTRLSSSYY